MRNSNLRNILFICLFALVGYNLFSGDNSNPLDKRKPITVIDEKDSRVREIGRTKPSNKSSNKKPASNNNQANSILADLQSKRLIYTKHARCRMDCRYIDEGEVKDILKNGRINQRKSKPEDYPCASYAVEGRTRDNQEVRIVFANCKDVTKVITTIDLGKKYNCDCK